MQDEDFFLSATELASRIRRREVSPVELVNALFERIARIDTHLHAYCTLAPDQARLAARTAEADLLHGKPVGPLHGVPVCVKDNLETAGIRTTYGSRLFEQFIPAEDAVAVARLKKAGAIVVGKTSLPEFAAKSVTDPPLFGHTRNPWATDRVAGGSSGGTAAAIAAGLAPAGLGNDAAGSIRIPAACCGIAGLKPSAGRVPQYPSSNPWEIASQTGPMARAVGDLDLLLRSIAGPDERDPLSLPALPGEESTSLEELVRPWRIAWSPDLGFARVDPEVLEVASDAVQDLSRAGTVEQVEVDLRDAEDAYRTLSAIRRGGSSFEWLDAQEHLLDPSFVEYARAGLAMTPADMGRAIQKRTRVYAAVEHLFRDYDLLVTPTLSVAAFKVGLTGPTTIDGEPTISRWDWMRFTYPFNYTGHPAASVPAGWTKEGLPVGLQIVGRRFADREVLAACQVLESVRPWSSRRPPLG